MDEYLIVPKHILEQQLKQLKTNKPPPEAVEVSNLGKLTGDILKRPGVSDWEKADLLASALRDFFLLNRTRRAKAHPQSHSIKPHQRLFSVNPHQWCAMNRQPADC